MKYYILLRGCDDKTIIPMDLSKGQIELLNEISLRSKKISRYVCMPVMYVLNREEVIDHLDEEDLEELEREWNV
jgi:hypothetical protein